MIFPPLSVTIEEKNFFSTHPEVAGDNAPFACEICDKKFTSKTSFNQHKIAHEQGTLGTEEHEDMDVLMEVRYKIFFSKFAEYQKIRI